MNEELNVTIVVLGNWMSRQVNVDQFMQAKWVDRIYYKSKSFEVEQKTQANYVAKLVSRDVVQ